MQPALRAPVAAALTWVNDTQGTHFDVTGLVDEDAALNAAPGDPYEIGLVLCDGEICKCERVRIEPVEDQFRFSLSHANQPDVPALLDPPEGIRHGWLDQQLAHHEFLVLLFYRGRW